MRHLVLVFSLSVLVSIATGRVYGLCDLSEEDGILCECREDEAVCELTKPLLHFSSLSNSSSVDALKVKRHVKTINTLVLSATRDESFLRSFPVDVLEEPMQLKNLSMHHASLGTLPADTVSGSSYLKYLTLTSCGIHDLMENAISNLQHLKSLDLSSNEIYNIRRGVFRELPFLKQLILVHNSIDTIESHAFVELRNLQYLNIRDNNLKQVDNLMFTGLNKLRELVLAYNLITHISDNTFMDLPNLEKLDLTANSISTIYPKTFRGMRDLKSLSLHFNQISTLPDGFLKDSPSVRYLNLGRNNLKTISLDTLKGLRAIRSNFVLDIKLNPMNCSCDLFFLRELRRKRMAASDDEFEEPAEFANLQCNKYIYSEREPIHLADMDFIQESCTMPNIEEHTWDAEELTSHSESLFVNTFLILVALIVQTLI